MSTVATPEAAMSSSRRSFSVRLGLWSTTLTSRFSTIAKQMGTRALVVARRATRAWSIAGATQDGVAVTQATLVTGVEVDRRPGVAAIGRHEELAPVLEVRDGDALRRTREADVGPRAASRLAMDSRP